MDLKNDGVIWSDGGKRGVGRLFPRAMGAKSREHSQIIFVLDIELNQFSDPATSAFRPFMIYNGLHLILCSGSFHLILGSTDASLQHLSTGSGKLQLLNANGTFGHR